MLRLISIFCFSFLFFSCHSQQTNDKNNSALSSYTFKPLSEVSKEKYTEAIEPLYEKMLLKKGFNGAILMAKNGEIVFEDYHGIYNQKTKDSITKDTPFHLASISKTFTAMAVLHLWEQGKLSLDDSIQSFFPNFPYKNITIKNLLSHQSGLQNYAYFMDNHKTEVIKMRNKRGKLIRVYKTVKLKDVPEIKGFISNEDVLQFLINKKPPVQALPGRVFNYCNTNYSLLALIIEKITKQPFPKYMKDSVFTPLGMTHTFVFNMADTGKYIPSYNYNKTPFKLEKFDCIYGDKNVYSTVRDLLLWDKALYSGTYIKASTLEMAMHPFSNERRKGHYYGLGWHLLVDDSGEDTIVYHNGWWHGNNTVFARLINDTATLIILGNKFNKNIYHARQLASVFSTITDTTNVEE